MHIQTHIWSDTNRQLLAERDGVWQLVLKKKDWSCLKPSKCYFLASVSLFYKPPQILLIPFKCTLYFQLYKNVKGTKTTKQFATLYCVNEKKSNKTSRSVSEQSFKKKTE